MVFRKNSVCAECPLQVFINSLTEKEVHPDWKPNCFQNCFLNLFFLTEFSYIN